MADHKKMLFINQVIRHAEFEGWSNETLEKCCLELQLDEQYYLLWFPQGIADIMEFLEAKYDDEMLSIIEQEAITGTTNKIALALKARILKTSKSKQLSIQNSRYYAKPQNWALGMRLAWRTADIIWHYAGDTSLDFNYYTKRGLLKPVYLASQTCYHKDCSENNIDTEKFIERALNQVVSSAKYLKQIPTCLNKIPVVRMFL